MDERILKEIKLSRQLAREIQWVLDSGGDMPVQIHNMYKPLKKFYDDCVIAEELDFYGK